MMSFDRRQMLAAGAAAVAVGAFPGVSRAAAALRNEGSNRIAVGDMTITTVNDGFLDLPAGMFPVLKPDEFVAMTRRDFRPDGPLRLPINAFVVTRGDQLTLIDSGVAGSFGPTAGRFAANLAATGVDAASVHTVLLTHLHADHVNGLLTKDGAAAFPNAELVVPKVDHAFWTDEGIASRAPEAMKPFFGYARAALKPYAGKVRLIESGEVAPGIEAMPLYGHTPGHTGYRITSGDKQILIWADIVHATALQFTRPDVTIAFDVDPQAAAAIRRRTMDMVATDRLLVAGSHLEFPGVGHAVRSGDAYAFVPAPWAYDL